MNHEIEEILTTVVDVAYAKHAILLVDGVCTFCDSGVNFIIERDRHDYFRFATIQSPLGQVLMKRHGLDPSILTSMVLIDNNIAYRKSAAALRIVRRLSGAWPLLRGLGIIPAFIRDAIYAVIATNRYRLFGKIDACRVPTPQTRDKFLENGSAIGL